MKKILLAGAAALLLTGATADPSFAAMRGTGGYSGGHVSTGAGRAGGSFSANTAPRAAVTGGNFNRGGTFNRGVTGRTFTGRTGFAGRPGFAGRTWAGRGFASRGGHWGWRHGRRIWLPGVAAGVGLGLAFSDWGWGDDCVVWNGWRYVNTCVGPLAWGGPGWGPGWGPGSGPGWW